MKQLRYGIIGGGFVAAFHLRAMCQMRGIEVAGLFTRAPEERKNRLIAFSRDHQLGEAKVYGSIKEMARHVDVVCIMPYYLRRCADMLAGSDVKPGGTIGFPHGGHTTAVKVSEAKQALADGGQELDSVINIGKARSGQWDYVRCDIQAVIEVAHEAGAKVKVIFENCHLNDAQKIRLCELCGELRADWVKTSTGYGDGGGTIPDLKLMRKYSPPHVQVKAAGGVPDLTTLLEVRAIGVTRVGKRSAGILDEAKRLLAVRIGCE